MTSMSEFRAEFASILRTDPERLPAVFGGRRPRALKVGIFFDIVAVYPSADSKRLRDWLGRYTSAKPYLWRLALGTHRHDLAGVETGRIDEDARQRARRRLAMIEPAPSTQRRGHVDSKAEVAHAGR